MIKKALFITIFSISIFTYSQEFNVGTNNINLGIGFGGNFGNYTTSSQSPGYSITYERGIWEVPGPGVVSLGAYLGTKTYKYNYTLGNDKWNYTIIGIRGAYHYNGLKINNLDVYGGLMASYNILSYSGAGSFNNKPSATGFVGGRWYFSDTFAAFAEASYGVAYITLGASIRF
ncbi:hypothetical protein [uncultured Maribacter sp.]|uniref:hypothetical protein n=1 Tax=uncultured Maribacter sp. TaxID=431308 RepID=UPI00260FF49A|nr:hypothetical protein [uncultured Maribacter sp.]